MNVRQLLEDANLSALGLLEPEEQHAFEKALLAAPEALREQVRAEQERWAGGSGLLVECEVPPELRQRVLDAVRAEIARASLGGHQHPQHQEGAHPSFNLTSNPPQDTLAFAPQRRTFAGWRMAAMIALSAAAVMCGAFLYTYKSNSAMRGWIEENRVLTNQLTTLGPDLVDKVIFDPATIADHFQLAAGPSVGRATLYRHPDLANARLFVTGLPPVENKTYRLVLLDSSGNVREQLAEFEGNLQRQAFEVSAASLESGSRLALLAVDLGKSQRELIGTDAAASAVLTATLS
jgi:hypothetical protein